MAEVTAYLTVQEVAAELGISADGVRKLIRRQKLRAIKRSERSTLIPRNAFIAYQRKLNCTVPEPLRLAAATGTLADRLGLFAERSKGQTPAGWLSGWVADEDPENDTSESMELAVDAFGLLLEQRTAGSCRADPFDAVARRARSGLALGGPGYAPRVVQSARRWSPLQTGHV
jgi:excisionase family DNA binding protein